LVDAGPWRYILVVGVLYFGGLMTAYLIITGSPIDTAASLGVVGGFVFGSVTWLVLKIAKSQ
jgi:hypothetical protein